MAISYEDDGCTPVPASWYIRFAGIFWLWDLADGGRYLTTCECPPFMPCGCRSFKLKLGILPRLGESFKVWRFDIYVLGFFLSWRHYKSYTGPWKTRILDYGFQKERLIRRPPSRPYNPLGILT